MLKKFAEKCIKKLYKNIDYYMFCLLKIAINSVAVFFNKTVSKMKRVIDGTLATPVCN